MRKGSIAVLCLAFAVAVPVAAEAKSATKFDYGFGYNDGPASGSSKSFRSANRYGGGGNGYATRGRTRGYAQGYGYARRGRVQAQAYGYGKGYGYGRQARPYAQAYNYTARPRAPLANRAMTSASVASLSGSAINCLSSEARGLLGRIEAQFGKVEIVSTCRPGATIAGTNYPSKHASGQAIDFRVPGRKGEVVNWLIANDHLGGIMTYSDMDHIHVDVGPRFVALNRPSGRT